MTKDVYKAVAKKAVEKVMRIHPDAEDASFLGHEGFHVQVLVQKYVEWFKARQQPPTGQPAAKLLTSS